MSASPLRSLLHRFFPFLAVLGSVTALGIGTSWAKHWLFPVVGAQGTTAVRVGFSALLVLLSATFCWALTLEEAAKAHLLTHRALEWNDPGGPWQLLMLQSVDALVSPAERMVQAVRALDLPHADSLAGPWVTISAGVCSQVPNAAPGGASGSAALIARADAALYAAKHQGRNCVVLADLQTPPPPPLAPVGLEPSAAAVQPAPEAAPHATTSAH